MARACQMFSGKHLIALAKAPGGNAGWGSGGTHLSSMDDERGTAPGPPLVTRTPGESRRGAAAMVRKQMCREMRQHFTATGAAD